MVLDGLPDDVICNIVIYANDTTLYSRCGQAPGLWQQLELASKLESDLQTLCEKCLVDFNAGKTQLVWFDRSNNIGSIDVKIDDLFLRKNHL